MKRRRRTIAICLSIFTLSTIIDAAKAGPFRDLFQSLRSAVAHPKQTPRPHRSTHKRKKTPSNNASKDESAKDKTPLPPGQPEVRWAKAGSIQNDEKDDLPYGTPVPGKPGLVTSPFAPDAGYVQVLGFPRRTPVEDPYTGKIFLTPVETPSYARPVLVSKDFARIIFVPKAN